MIRSFILAALVLGMPALAHAEDEFGARFNDNAPPALTAGEEAATIDPQAPQNIEPAAGEQAPVTEPVAILPETSLSTETENKAEENANEIETKL